MPDFSDLPSLPSPSVLAHVVDVHCHPTDSPIDDELFSTLPHHICAMATRGTDQELVADLARRYPDKVTPCFESHYRALFLPDDSPKPEHEAAFARLLPSLPPPTPLSQVLPSLHASLASFPTAMLGEVGLDRVCRVPFTPPADPPYASASAEPDGARELSPFTIPLAHQAAVLEAQLALAVELRRNVSTHSVKAQQATLELLARMRARYGRAWDAISVDMHSCGLSAQTWIALEKAHCNVFLSLSTAINARSPAHAALIRACSPDRLLVESDFHDIAYSAPYVWDMVCRIADARGWPVERSAEDLDGEDGVVQKLEENWRRFVEGGHKPRTRKRRDRRRLLLDESESDEEASSADV
ncbi:TatD DNase family Scn1 [Rhodofomes roseus]|uniref:TatD DNase family Scn1 n=1 Tax=Rhodofomes roseus TaxID=34475 RepID=A0ABQ8KHD5_9APHY|nr:TatD DNase family Scn1 [Rhodofomes roseus]KAH9837257.1 TatD DNase family Scn1 [Rhodofomes roseus]